MLNATEVFLQLDSKLRTLEGDGHQFSDTLSQQLALAQQIQSLMTDAEQCIGAPEFLLGPYRFSDRAQPFSSTGEVLFVEQDGGERLALKFLTKLDGNNHFVPNHDHMYAFQHPAVRAMTTIGESLMGKAANISVPFPMYFGAAGVTEIGEGGVNLLPFDVSEILAGKMEPVIVMRAMRTSLSDVLLDTREAEEHGQTAPYSSEQLKVWTDQVFHKVLNSSVPLSIDLSAQIGAPKEIEKLMIGKTVGWLASREEDSEVQKHPELVAAVAKAKQVQELFGIFFALQETPLNLATRAVPLVKNGQPGPLGKLSQTFGPGDTKFSNVMIGQHSSGSEAVGLFDPQWLILNPGAQGNDRHAFAPWPFADFMQIAAYTASEPASYGFPDLQQAIYDNVRNYYGKEHWSEWHELYLKLLTSYKMLVDVAVSVDSFIQKKASGQEIPRELHWRITKHPRAALELAKRALRVYDDHKNNHR